MSKFTWQIKVWWLRVRLEMMKRQLIRIRERIQGQRRYFRVDQLDLPLES